MGDETKNKFTLKIVLSYLVLATLALVVGFFIISEIKVYLSNETSDENDAKLLKTSSLLTQLYEAESLSKSALQTKSNFNAYAQKIDTISVEIDSLKLLTASIYQQSLLDSVNLLLRQKVANSNELRKLKMRTEASNSLDKALEEFKKMEVSLGKITPEALAPNINELPPKAQSVIRDIAAYLNKNVPKNANNIPDTEQLDSIINVSKAFISEAKQKDTRTQRFLARKELEITSNDLELSQQLRSIISAFEQEVIVNTYNDNLKKQAAVRRSIRLAGFAALLGFIIVGIFTLLINRDFWKVQTYRQKLEKEKKFSESLLKSREQLISTVSHDLRTPLNTITGYSELIENTPLTDKQRSYLKNVTSASQYVDSLVNDLLDFSKLEAGKIKIEKIPFILSDLIRETAENLREIHKKKAIELKLEIDEKLDGAVFGDPFRIRQIITNLISNAYKFTQEGFIKVAATITSESATNYIAHIQVEDSGIGIKKEKQHLIFREFTQADDFTEKKYGGYGLGLTISKKLSELLGGGIELKSEEGTGSVFTLTIPLEKSKSTLQVPSRNPIRKNEVNLSLLIIDDDTSMLQLLKEVCSSLGIETHTYPDFKNIGKQEKIMYDAVLTDIQMPNIDGFGVLRNLMSAAYEHYREQPVIAMTGRRDLDSQVYLNAGFSEIIQKPFTKAQLLTKLSQLFPNRFYSKQEENEPKLIKKDSKLYDLEIISSFLGKNQDAINEVLQTFVSDTELNTSRLEAAIRDANFKQINDVCHKMLPMFRQLAVDTALPDLEFLETVGRGDATSGELQKRFINLQTNISHLLKALKSYLVKSPSYID